MSYLRRERRTREKNERRGVLGREGTACAKRWRCEACSWKPESLNVGVWGTRPGRQAGVASTESPTCAPWHCLQIKQLCLQLDSL